MTPNQSSAGPFFDDVPIEVRSLVDHYVLRLDLPTDDLWVTANRRVYSTWLGRRVPAAYGGAYCYLRHARRHAVLINLDRIDRSLSWAPEVVVAEELVHMRDHLDGDFRRHAKHGHDRIAVRVSQLTGVSIEDLPRALLPVRRQPWRYVYACPSCGVTVKRKRKGTWSCGRCSPTFDRRYVLRIAKILPQSNGDVQ